MVGYRTFGVIGVGDFVLFGHYVALIQRSASTRDCGDSPNDLPTVNLRVPVKVSPGGDMLRPSDLPARRRVVGYVATPEVCRLACSDRRRPCGRRSRRLIHGGPARSRHGSFRLCADCPGSRLSRPGVHPSKRCGFGARKTERQDRGNFRRCDLREAKFCRTRSAFKECSGHDFRWPFAESVVFRFSLQPASP